MNKKLMASGMALALCLTAIAPVYKNLSYNREILEPAKIQQQAGTQAEDLIVWESETMKAEDIATKSMNAPIAETAVKAASTAPAAKSTAAAAKASAPAVKKSATASKNTGTTLKKSSNTSNTKTASKARTSVSRGGSSASTSRSTTASTASAASSKAGAIIATAKSYIGIPYVWGGVTPSGFDCSGFTQYVLNKNGITIPRVTSDQFGTGTSVSKSNLRAGDLVFFTTYKPGPSHVGFYMGGGKFIHASSSKGVTISSLDSTYYSSRYIGAKRVF